MRLPAVFPAVASLLVVLLSYTDVATCQDVAPTNDTVPADQSLEIEVNLANGHPATVVPLVPAWSPDQHQRSGLNDSSVQEVNINGLLVLTNASNFAALNESNIALINCDPEGYVGEFNLTNVIGEATGRVWRNPGPSLLRRNGGAIILYSERSSRCTFNVSQDDGYNYQNVFTLTDQTSTQALLSFENTSGNDQNHASIHFHDPNSDDQPGNGGGGGAFGPAPTTTIAMVILYVITGMITLLFLVIIISGAIRAHRHPERYRNRTLLGRPVQGSRARGLAAAMLDTIPIVKFGEQREEPNKPGDVEMQNTSPSPEPNQERSATTAAADASNPSVTATPPTAVAATTEPSSAATAGAADATPSPPSPIVDESLACSVCTDDFVKGQDLRVLPCNHKFHPECIDPWLLNVSGTCPLCRVDLRPPEARSPPASPNTSISADGPAADNSNPDGPDGPAARPQRRSGTLSTILHRALNRQHMSSATPAQRLEALRDLRRHHHHQHHHNNNRRGDSPAASSGSSRNDAGAEADERTRSRVGTRLSRFLGRDRAVVQTSAQSPVQEEGRGASEGSTSGTGGNNNNGNGNSTANS